MSDDVWCATCGHPEEFHNGGNRCNAAICCVQWGTTHDRGCGCHECMGGTHNKRCSCAEFVYADANTIPLETLTEHSTVSLMNLTTSESEVNCLLHAAEKYSAARKAENKPTSIIDTLIERLKTSPQAHDLVFVRRFTKASTCSECSNIPVRDGRCLIHAPKDPFI